MTIRAGLRLQGGALGRFLGDRGCNFRRDIFSLPCWSSSERSLASPP
jgi:hypothetical protein